MSRPRGLQKTGGRIKGTPNKATAEIRGLAGAHGPALVAELARLALHAENEATRVAAIRELLDRAYGKPTQPFAGDADGGPLQTIFRVERVIIDPRSALAEQDRDV